MGRDTCGPSSFMREARTPAGSLYLLAAVGCSSDGSGVISQLRVIPPVLKPSETLPPPAPHQVNRSQFIAHWSRFPGRSGGLSLGL